MGIRTSRFKVYLLKSRIDLLEKINMKPCFILYNDDGQSKLGRYIKDAHNNGKNYFDTGILKSFKIGPEIPKIWGNK